MPKTLITTEKLEKLYGPQTSTSTGEVNDTFATFLKERFNKMSEHRTQWLENTLAALKLYDVFSDWLVHGEDYDKPIRFPTLRDFAQSLRDEFVKNPPSAEVEAVRGANPHRAQALKFVVESIKNNIHEKRVKLDCLEDMILYGIGFRKINYQKVTKQKMIEGKEKTITTWDNVGSVRLDPRNVFVDEHGRYMYDPKGYEQKRDMIIRYFYSWSQFLDVFKDREGVIEGLETKISPVSYSQENYADNAFESDRELVEKSTTTGVKVYEYINQETDTYAVVANGVTIIHPRPIENNHGRIPVVPYILEKRRDSFWPMSLAELIAPYVYAQETMFNLEFKGLKLRLQPVLAIDKGLGFNQRVHKARDGAVWEFGVPPGESISNKVMQLPLGNTDSNGFHSMNNLIESLMTVTTNQDRKAMFLSPGELATQTAFKHQSMQKRASSIIFVNEIEAEGQLTELMISDIKQFLVQKVDTMVSGKSSKRYRKIKVEGYKVRQGDEGDVQFIAELGASGYFDITADSIDVDVDVNVIDSRSKALLQEQKVGRILQFIPVATNLISAFAQVNPELLNSLNVTGIIEQAAEAIDMDLDKTIISEKSERDDQIQQEHMAFITEQMVAVPEGETAEESRKHLKDHIKLRYIYRSSRRTDEETQIWKDMSKRSKDMWLLHYMETVKNAFAYETPQEPQLLKPQEDQQQEPPLQKEGALPKQKMPSNQFAKPAPEEGLIQKTLLRE